MTPIETLKLVLETKIGISVPLIEASLFSANVMADTLRKQIDFPVFVLIPVMITTSERINKSMVKRKIPIFGFMLYGRTPAKGTADFKFDEARPVVEAAKTLCDKLVNALYNEAITYKGEEDSGIRQYKSTETYAKFDAHLFGCQLSFEWDVVENVTC
jgi:hypothetical protein